MNFSTGSFKAGTTTILPVFVGQNVEKLGLTLKDYYGKKKDHPVAIDHEGTRFLFVGMGDADKFNLNKYRDVIAQGARAAVKEALAEVTVLLPEGTSFSTEELVHVTVEAYVLGQYRFDKYKSSKEDLTVENVVIAKIDGELTGQEEAIRTGRIYGEGTTLARDLKNEPANKLRPYDLAAYAEELFKGTAATVRVFKGDDLVKHQFNGTITVGKGSDNPPVLIEITYAADASKPKTALVGKGITFDTGGISLKTYARDLSNMRMDMGGSAAVLGALYILTRLNAPVNVVGLIASAENNPSGKSVLPGDIIEYPNGKTVQVANTDAEGRLVLADALLYSKELGAERVVDIATLTGACAAALGSKIAGVMGEESIVAGLKQSAKTTGENVWELPLLDEYEDLLYSPYADIRNITDSPGAITAGLFLRRFVDTATQKWAHIDIAGPMEINRSGSFSNEGATGFGARLLADFVRQN